MRTTTVSKGCFATGYHTERRIDTLNAHIAHSEDFKKYRKIAEKRDALYAEHRKLSQQGLLSKGKAQKALKTADAFADKHFAALLDYDDAETQKVEQIRRSVADIMRAEPREWTPKKVRGMEL